ncbi:hypothetical protein LWM68_26735 [Niabella sp. W65]|nr:hypothetical protein [Niabella sp. W65]MCH7366049.1 hypothetical protein [Niabella sp. W65]ULT41779.1 hypothetical protein KRR40_45630 [Niabella sp. I65]
MQIAKNASQQNRITNLNQMTDVDNQLKEADRVYTLNKKLYDKKAIGLQELKQSENAYNYQLAKKTWPPKPLTRMPGHLSSNWYRHSNLITVPKMPYR